MQPVMSAADYSKLDKTFLTRSRMRELSCLVVGAGALGNEVARILGLLNAGNVMVVDPDSVEPSNLPRSTFFFSKPNVIGQNKAEALAEAATAMFPDVRWSGRAAEIADVGFQDGRKAGIWFSCGDSDLVRTEIAYISTKLGIPVADAGLGTQNYSHGRVTYFPGGRGQACYCCMLTTRKRRQLLETWHAPLRSCAAEDPLEEPDVVSTPTMASIIGAAQVEFGLRSLFRSLDGLPTMTVSLEIRLHPERKLSEFVIQRSEDCPFHQESRESLETLPKSDCTIDDLLETAAARWLELDWPICTRARCMVCGYVWAPMLRLAALRRRAICPNCRARKILELEAVRMIEGGSPWAALTPAQLGLPSNHLYAVRRSAKTQ